MLTTEVKKQIAHYEKNMLNLEESSDFDSSEATDDEGSLDIEDIELAEISSKAGGSTIADDVLRRINQSHVLSPKKQKRREKKKEDRKEKLRIIYMRIMARKYKKRKL